MLYFSLGRELGLGHTTRVFFERAFRQSTPAQPWFAMEMDATPQERLLLRVHLPPALGCNRWAREEWSDGTAQAQLLHDERFVIAAGEAVVASYEIVNPQPWRHFRIRWWRGNEPG